MYNKFKGKSIECVIKMKTGRTTNISTPLGIVLWCEVR